MARWLGMDLQGRCPAGVADGGQGTRLPSKLTVQSTAGGPGGTRPIGRRALWGALATVCPLHHLHHGRQRSVRTPGHGPGTGGAHGSAALPTADKH